MAGDQGNAADAPGAHSSGAADPTLLGLNRFETLIACHDLALAVSHMTTFELDTISGTLSWSPNTDQVLGCSRSEIPTSLRSLLAPMLAGPMAQRSDSEYELEQCITTSQGEERFLLVRARSWRNDHDALQAGLYGAVVDVTEQRRAEHQLVDLIDRYRLLVELSPDAIAVHEGGVIRFANPAAYKLSRFQGPTMIGSSIVDFVEPSELEDLLARILSLTEPGMVSDPAVVTMVAGDGARFKIESVSVRTTWEGRPAYQVIMRDISEREKAKAALRAQANLVEAVSDAIIATDPDGRVTSWNPAAERIFGWSAAEVIGRDFTELELPAEDVKPILAMLEAEGNWSGDLVMSRKDGTVVPIHASIASMREPDDRFGRVGVCSDQSMRHAAEAAKAYAEERFSTVVSALDEGIVVIGADGQVQSTNPAAERILACTFDEIRDRFIDGHAFEPRGEDGEPLAHGGWPVHAAMSSNASVSQQIVAVRRPERDRVWLRMNVRPLDRPTTGAHHSFVCSFTDITAQHQQAAELAWTASHDELTGLPNRVAMTRTFERALEDYPFHTAALFCNLDRFKDVNERLGYGVGDAVLCQIAGRLEHMTRAGDIAGRLAGDEFLLLCTNVTIEEAVRMAERVVFELGRPLEVQLETTTMSVSVGASVGVAHIGDPSMLANDVTELLQAADVAMHQAKARGTNRVEVFDGTLRDEARRRLDLREDLRIALDAEALEVHYQPIWRTHADPASCEVVGFEALVRWDHPTRGRQNPENFVAVAEETGLISQLGAYVLERACRQAVGWRADGHDVYISVNLSAHQLSNENLVSSVATTLVRTGLPPKALWLELTESALADEGHDAVSVLQELVGLGVRISIDDFGTGYSSLGRLRHYPVSALKVDRTFVADMTEATASDGKGDGGAIVHSTIALAHRLGLAVIAEGVETADQLAGLASLNCELSQGFLLGRPVPASQVSFDPLTH